jgi:hypothetical protein
VPASSDRIVPPAAAECRRFTFALCMSNCSSLATVTNHRPLPCERICFWIHSSELVCPHVSRVSIIELLPVWKSHRPKLYKYHTHSSTAFCAFVGFSPQHNHSTPIRVLPDNQPIPSLDIKHCAINDLLNCFENIKRLGFVVP